MGRASGLLLGASVALSLLAPAVMAAPTPLPGDRGRTNGDGIPPLNPPPRQPGPAARSDIPAPTMAMALKAATAIARGCKQYPLGVAVVNAVGEPILIYIPDGTIPRHGYTAVRKAYSAITFRADTSKILPLAYTDAAIQAQLKADPNLQAYKGGVLIQSHGSTIGAIGVSGAEPGAHDEECGLIGLAAIAKDLK